MIIYAFTILNNSITSPLYLLYFNVGKFKALSQQPIGRLNSRGRWLGIHMEICISHHFMYRFSESRCRGEAVYNK